MEGYDKVYENQYSKYFVRQHNSIITKLWAVSDNICVKSVRELTENEMTVLNAKTKKCENIIAFAEPVRATENGWKSMLFTDGSVKIEYKNKTLYIKYSEIDSVVCNKTTVYVYNKKAYFFEAKLDFADMTGFRDLLYSLSREYPITDSDIMKVAKNNKSVKDNINIRKEQKTDFIQLMRNVHQNMKFEHLSPDYDRKKYEDKNIQAERMKKARSEGKTVRDAYTGKTLHFDANAAKNKYGSEKSHDHIPNYEHIMPLKKKHDELNNGSFADRVIGQLITDNDYKNVMNSNENITYIGERINKQKGAKSAEDFCRSNPNLSATTTENMIAKGEEAEIYIKKVLTQKAIKNFGGNVAKESITATVEAMPTIAYNEYIAVKNGKKTAKEAVKDGAKMTGKVTLQATVYAALNIAVDTAFDAILKK